MKNPPFNNHTYDIRKSIHVCMGRQVSVISSFPEEPWEKKTPLIFCSQQLTGIVRWRGRQLVTDLILHLHSFCQIRTHQHKWKIQIKWLRVWNFAKVYKFLNKGSCYQEHYWALKDKLGRGNHEQGSIRTKNYTSRVSGPYAVTHLNHIPCMYLSDVWLGVDLKTDTPKAPCV